MIFFGILGKGERYWTAGAECCEQKISRRLAALLF